MNKLSERIISFFEEENTNPSPNDSLFVLLFTTLLYSFLIYILMYELSFTSFKLFFIENLFILPLIVAMTSIHIVYLSEIKKIFTYISYEILHMILPNKKNRTKEILAYLEINNPNKFAKAKSHNYTTKEAPSYNELPEFIKKFGSTRSFRELAFRHCEKRDSTIYDVGLLEWATNLPLERLNEDQRLSILKYNSIEKFSSTYNCITNVEQLFKNYSPKQIVTLFSSNFICWDYIEELISYSTKLKEVQALPVEKSIRTLMSKMRSGHKTIFPKENYSLEGSNSLGIFFILETLGN